MEAQAAFRALKRMKLGLRDRHTNAYSAEAEMKSGANLTAEITKPPIEAAPF